MNIELEIDNATQYATAYCDGKPVATLQRRRVYDKGPAWKAYDTQGALLFETSSIFNGSARLLARRVARAIERRNIATECQWFLNCTNPATDTEQHPILGAVPICARCKAKVAALS